MAAPLAVGSTVNFVYHDWIMPGGGANRQVTNGTVVAITPEYLEFTMGGVDFAVAWGAIQGITVT